MNYFFAKSEILKSHAVLYDSAGSVKSSTQKETGFCYLRPKIPSFSFLVNDLNIFLLSYIKNICFNNKSTVQLLIIFISSCEESSWNHDSGFCEHECFEYKEWKIENLSRRTNCGKCGFSSQKLKPTTMSICCTKHLQGNNWSKNCEKN